MKVTDAKLPKQYVDKSFFEEVVQEDFLLPSKFPLLSNSIELSHFLMLFLLKIICVLLRSVHLCDKYKTNSHEKYAKNHELNHWIYQQNTI